MNATGYDYISQVSANPRFERFLNGLWDEAVATLPPLPDIDIVRYRRDLLARYRNAALPHRTRQIAMDGSQKLPQRLFFPIRERLQAGAPIVHMALAVAGWMRNAGGIDDRGAPIDIRDPLAAEFRRFTTEPVALSRMRACGDCYRCARFSAMICRTMAASSIQSPAGIVNSRRRASGACSTRIFF